jgi:hypothetical protein
VVLSGTPASSTTKTGRHDIAEILLKMALSTINQIKSSDSLFSFCLCTCISSLALKVKVNDVLLLMCRNC